MHIEITSFRALNYKMVTALYTNEKSRNLEKYIYIGTLFNFFYFYFGVLLCRHRWPETQCVD